MIRKLAAITATLGLLTGAALLARVGAAGALPPLGTVTTETVGGFSFQFTYDGPEWLLLNVNDTNAGLYKHAGISTLMMAQSGANTTLAASQCNAANAIEAMEVKYQLADLGYFWGHSSSAALVTKSIRHHPSSNVACADRLVSHLKGVGLSGVSWRVDTSTPTTPWSQGGVPAPPVPWPAQIRHIWWATGVFHDPVNRWAMGGADENTLGIQTMSMTITEAWAMTVGMFPLNPQPLPTPVIPTTITAPVIFDHAGVDEHERVVVTPNEGHVEVSAAMDWPADYWATMLAPTDQPSTTTTTSGPTSTTAATTTTTAGSSSTSTTSTTAPASSTTQAATTTQPSTTTTTTVDPVRQAIVAARDAAQHALDVYDQAHP